MSLDANTYYLNQHLDAVDNRVRNAEEADRIAKEAVEDVNGPYWPWRPEAIREAVSEVSDEQLARVVASRFSDAGLACVIRDIVSGYWYSVALSDTEESLTKGD